MGSSGSKITARAPGFLIVEAFVCIPSVGSFGPVVTYRHEGEVAPVFSHGRRFGNHPSCLELLWRLARLVHEAKCMSSENVNLRKQLSSEQERWRAAERSRAKHDERRRIEMERKSDDVHALRYRCASCII